MNVVYVSPNAISTALVKSQVIPYLVRLADLGVASDLVTFERGDDAGADGSFPRARWHAIRARSGGTLPSRIVDLVRGTMLVLYLVVRRRARIVHARSYLPAAIAWAVTRITRTPYIFDMRGFLAEEYTEGRYWRASDLRYRAMLLAERPVLGGAAGVVVLSERAAQRLRTDPRSATSVRGKPIVVVPSAVDTTRFRPVAERSPAPTLVYAGSLGMSYALDAMLRVYAAARARVPDLRFLVLNLHDHALIADAVGRLGLHDTDVVVRAAPFDEMPRLLATSNVGICLLEQVRSKEASSPIKVGEYLASGLPVVVNRGQGDVADHVDAARAGHVMTSYDMLEIARAGEALAALIDDVGARRRARSLAVERYDVRGTAEAYFELYRRIAP